MIDLCTPNVEMNDNVILPMVLQNIAPSSSSSSNTMLERFPNLRYRWSILACYPIKQNEQEHGEPLLVNIPRM